MPTGLLLVRLSCIHKIFKKFHLLSPFRRGTMTLVDGVGGDWHSALTINSWRSPDGAPVFSVHDRSEPPSDPILGNRPRRAHPGHAPYPDAPPSGERLQIRRDRDEGLCETVSRLRGDVPGDGPGHGRPQTVKRRVTRLQVPSPARHHQSRSGAGLGCDLSPLRNTDRKSTNESMKSNPAVHRARRRAGRRGRNTEGVRPRSHCCGAAGGIG